MIMAGASCDDIFVIVLFTTFLSMAQGGSADIIDFVNIPFPVFKGLLSIIFLFAGSNARANAGSESVTKFIHKM